MRIPVQELAEQYKDSIFRASFSICRNPEDAKDVVQETFLQYMESSRQFENEEHIKAWLLKTAINKSKNITKTFWHRNRSSLEDYLARLTFPGLEGRDLIEAVLSLPASYLFNIHFKKGKEKVPRALISQRFWNSPHQRCQPDLN